MHVRTDRANAGAEAQSEGGPTGVSQGATYGDAGYRSSSSASPAKKRRKKRARKTREPLHEMEGRVHATDFVEKRTPYRVDRRDTPAQAVEHRDPTCRGGFGTDITNRKVVGRARSSEGSPGFGEESNSVEGNMGPRESTPEHPARRNVGLKPSCGRDVCGLVLGAEEQASAHTVVAYITIHVLLASDPPPEGSKLCAAVDSFVPVDLEVLLATGSESHNSILKLSKIFGGIFLIWSVDIYCLSLNVHISLNTTR